ncbi:hypothetical protein HPP92_028661 [Vanilla planifolia]|uniref:Uncharacterized protein n=1 Tax=Vanilla planifolia TaxID=51239 RepID=A0A835P7U9_VANPL|nr:hypothetical protein HPP92_028661 [Vanilla planifolia]
MAYSRARYAHRCFPELHSFVTAAFVGHLGKVELAAVSIAQNVIEGFAYGTMFSNKRREDDLVEKGLVTLHVKSTIRRHERGSVVCGGKRGDRWLATASEHIDNQLWEDRRSNGGHSCQNSIPSLVQDFKDQFSQKNAPQYSQIRNLLQPSPRLYVRGLMVKYPYDDTVTKRRQAYSLVIQERHERQLSSELTQNFTIAVNVRARHRNKKYQKRCDHCNRSNHTIEECRTLKYYCKFCDKKRTPRRIAVGGKTTRPGAAQQKSGLT